MIDRNGDYTLYYYKRNSDGITNDDDELINEIAWVVDISFERIHLFKALGHSGFDIQGGTKTFIYRAINKEVSLLYYIRYEPTDESQKQLLTEDPKRKYINKIIAVNLRRDRFDFDQGARPPIQSEKLQMLITILDTAHNIYMRYLEETIEDKMKLEYLLNNKYQILYLSTGSVLIEFHNQGLYKWFYPLVMKHIQSRYHFKRSYGISLSPATTHVLKKDGYICVKKFNIKTCECLDQTTSDLFKNNKDDPVEISVLEKIHDNF